MDSEILNMIVVSHNKASTYPSAALMSHQKIKYYQVQNFEALILEYEVSVKRHYST